MITVMGVGNPIMGDDGVGLELLAAVRAACPDSRIDYVDGGTGGMELIPVVQDAQRLLILDAVAGAVPGAVVEVVGDQIPRLMSSKISPHQLGLRDVFSAARLLGREPDEAVVVGIVPESVELRVGLSGAVTASLPEATARAAAVISDWLGGAAPEAG
jgi:hydrogenase maturation protease